MKILYVTTVGSTMNFFIDTFKMLLSNKVSLEIATNLSSPLPQSINDMNVKSYDVPFSRNPLSKENFKAYKILKKIIDEGEYDVVHCHTPNAAVITRFACRKYRKKGLKVFYTAHGFHFYKGAPLKNWLFFYPIEWLCSFWTDKLVTINSEDFKFANKHFYAKEIIYIPGVGLDKSNFVFDDKIRIEKRNFFNLKDSDVAVLSVGELNDNKNHQLIIKAIKKLNNSNVHYFIAGKGDKRVELINLSKKLNIENQIHLLGFRNDVKELYMMSDIYVLPSIREGLNVSIMEAMSIGLPCVVSNIRGNVDLVDPNGGSLFNPFDVNEAYNSLRKIIEMSNEERLNMGRYNSCKSNDYSNDVIIPKVLELYK